MIIVMQNLLNIVYMCESFQDESWIQDFEADLQWDYNSFF